MRRVIVIGLMMFLGARAGFAQDSISSVDAEVIYPVGVRFTIVVEASLSSISAAQLEIQGEGSFTQTIDIDLLEAFVLPPTPEPMEGSEQPTPTPTPSLTTALSYIWMLEEENLPQLFSTMAYEWRIELNDGDVFTADGEFVFRDPRYEWSRFEGTGVTLTIPTFIANSAALSAEMRSIYNVLSHVTETNPNFNLLVYPERLRPDCERRDDGTRFARGVVSGVEIPCSSRFAVSLVEQSGYVAVGRPDEVRLRDYLVTWLIDAFLDEIWADKEVPLWFRSALERFFLPEGAPSALSNARTGVRANRDLTLAQMGSAPQPDNVTLWEAQAYGMMLYIVDRAGVDGLYHLIRLESGDFEAEYQEITGVSLRGLIGEWEGWLFTSAAEIAFGVSPYQAPTHTPTITPTFTLTSTQTPTATTTNTPLPLTDTVFPTITPSRTLTQSPPTNTPRPPGSLDTPTPVPASGGLSSALGNPTTQAVVVTVLVILIVIAVIVYIRMGKR
jgi:hypothetical protein